MPWSPLIGAGCSNASSENGSSGGNNNATNPTSLDFQQRFADAVPDVVTGRRIDEVRVSRLAGSSGTPDGFNDALQEIRNEASR